MNNNIYITSDFEKSNIYVENSFEVDKEIADIIILLNKKGYKTLNSCAGHYNENTGYRESVSKSAGSKEDLLTYLKHNKLTFLGEDDDNYYYESIIMAESSYIMFDKDIVLPFYPKGFNYNEEWNDISRRLKFYDNEDVENKRDKKDVKLDISEAVKSLEEWAEKLPKLEINENIRKR